eukprot:TRINITY_DN9057_c0_g1_i1.p1 TRINITY_DN9057_c0_g1~~TRINITY_DN9057_c0_g1_i1.p1  ORF type:complete len:336 (+),score=65.72 TRINITY_DN9057_c0_g1_i1:126-1010(+)
MIATDYSDRQISELRELASVHAEESSKFRELLLRHNDVEVSLHDTIRYKLAEESERIELDRRGRDRVRDWKMNELIGLQQELDNDGGKPTVISSTPEVQIRVPHQHYYNQHQNQQYQHRAPSPVGATSPYQGMFSQQHQQHQQQHHQPQPYQGGRMQREYQPRDSNGLVNSQLSGNGGGNISIGSDGDNISILNDIKHSPVRSERAHQPGKVTVGSYVSITTNPDSLELLCNLTSCKYQPHLCGVVGVVNSLDASGVAQVQIHNVGVETIPSAALQIASGRQQQSAQSRQQHVL